MVTFRSTVLLHSHPNTTMLREFKKERNARMSGNKTIIWNRHSYFSPTSSRFLFVFNLFLLIGSKLIYADAQQDSSSHYHDDACPSDRDWSSEPHNCKWTNKNTVSTAFRLLVSASVSYFVLFDCITLSLSLSPQVQSSLRQ
jgi:hypothetical protein